MILLSFVGASHAAVPEPTDAAVSLRDPVHEVALDLDEGTWVSVSVHDGTVVFDLLGDLWTVPLAGGTATRLTSGPAWDVQPTFSPDGSRIAFTSDRGGNENIWLMQADGTDLEPLTEEEVARCTHPVWDPTGPYVVFRRRTVDTRSIGVTELWQAHVEGGKGFALTELDAHPHAGEPWPDDTRYLYFSSRQGRFEYDKDPVAGLWRVMRLDRRTGELRPIAFGPGSASRPTLSPDGKALYVVTRRRASTLLERLELGTGDRTVVADWLSPDELEGFALHGTYPRMDWTEQGELVLWAQGKLWRLDPDTGARTEIPFRAQGSWTQRDITRPRLSLEDEVRARVLRWPRQSARGDWAFSAMGILWTRDPSGRIRRVSEGSGYAPAWSPDGRRLAWTSWSDDEGGALHITDRLGRGQVLRLGGQLTNPTWSDDGRSLVVLRGVGGSVIEDLAVEPWYEAMLLERKGFRWQSRVVTSLDARWGDRKQQPRLHAGRLWFLEFEAEKPRGPEHATLVSVALDGTDRQFHLKLGEATGVVISPDFTRIAYTLDHQLWVAALPPFAREIKVEALPRAQLTKVVGDWIGWSPDSTRVTWAEGPVLKWHAVDAIWDDGEGASEDPYGDDDAEEEDESDEPEEGSDPEALEDDDGVESLEIALTVPRYRPPGAVVIRGARVITMKGDEVLVAADVLIEADRITAVGPDLEAPAGARELEGAGKTLLPGLVDVHAHLHFSSGDILPESEWRYEVALDYGVTTVQDPSALTDLVFTQKERVAAGFMRGPRVFSTGAVLYGADWSKNADTPTLNAARAHVRRLAAVGATSVKVYQQSQRERRQWYVQACEEEQVLCVPEGGGDLWMNLGMVADGYPAIEHALPTAPVYRDVIEFFAASTGGDGDGYGTFYTPTLAVAYGGLSGKHYFIQRDFPVADDPWLRRHYPARQLEAELWRAEVMAHPSDWRFQQVARDAARLADAGGKVTLGAHGELQGLGVHWELWSLATEGALSPHAALRAATLDGARYIGIDHEVGSIEVGKRADLLLVDGNPLEDLSVSTRIVAVLKNGEIVVERDDG